MSQEFRGETITDLEALVDGVIEQVSCGAEKVADSLAEQSETFVSGGSNDAMWPSHIAAPSAGIQPTPEARAESFREFRGFLAFEIPIEVQIYNANKLLINMMANNFPKESIDRQVRRVMRLLGAQGEQC